MSMVRLLAFETLTCGCVVGHYREAGTLRTITYVEEKNRTCLESDHRRNHTTASAARTPHVVPVPPGAAAAVSR